MSFWKIKKLDYWWTAIELKKAIPALKDLSADDIAEHLRGSGLCLLKEERHQQSILMRLSLPFGLLLMLVLFILSPVNFMITGKWGYKWRWLSNYFTSLGF